MAEIVNLRRMKKQRTAEAREAEAAQNRILHGRTKGEKLRDRMEHERAVRTAENTRLDPPPEA